MALTLADCKAFGVKLPPGFEESIRETPPDRARTIRIHDGWNTNKIRCKNQKEVDSWIEACNQFGWDYEI